MCANSDTENFAQNLHLFFAIFKFEHIKKSNVRICRNLIAGCSNLKLLKFKNLSLKNILYYFLTNFGETSAETLH